MFLCDFFFFSSTTCSPLQGQKEIHFFQNTLFYIMFYSAPVSCCPAVWQAFESVLKVFGNASQLCRCRFCSHWKDDLAVDMPVSFFKKKCMQAMFYLRYESVDVGLISRYKWAGAGLCSLPYCSVEALILGFPLGPLSSGGGCDCFLVVKVPWLICIFFCD